MSKYDELVKALRYCVNARNCEKCRYRINNNSVKCRIQLVENAAAAIEELDAEETRLLLLTSDLQDKLMDLQEQLNDADVAAEDDRWQIEELQAAWFKSETDATNLTGRLAQAEADIKRLKEVIDELREAQTYIDHYGDKWMTSAKDVPTSAYEHGYADGRDEAEAQLPKRGKWVLQASGQDCKCSVCESYWIPFGDEYDYKFCPNCGAKMIGEQNVE